MSHISLKPYLFFTGNCREAMEFYKSVFGGDLTLQTYGEVPGDKPDFMKGKDDYVMNSELVGGHANIMASDSTRNEPFGQSFISMTLTGDDDEGLRDIFAKLSEGGTVQSELKKEFWGDTFGTLTDKFGVEWMVNIADKK